MFEDFGDFETFPEMSVYDNIQYYKLHLLKELAKEYDEVLYLDFDVIPMQPINFFTAFDLQSYLCLKSKTYPVNRDIFKQTPSSRRGYVASITLRNTKGIDIIATNEEGSKTINIQVKTTLIYF